MKYVLAAMLLLSCSATAKERVVVTTIHVVRTEERGTDTFVFATMRDAHIRLKCVPQQKVGCGWLEAGDYPAEVTGNGKSIWITGRGLFDSELGRQHFTYSGGW